ncbi:hypothetical protein ACOSQ4_013890 [Xanthoceras sorbifolium]
MHLSACVSRYLSLLKKYSETYVAQRPATGANINKVHMLLSFKEQEAHLLTSSFGDHKSLVDAVKLVNVVMCAISGFHIRSHQILLQLKLLDSIKEAGNVKRFLPSEFGTDPATMENAKAICICKLLCWLFSWWSLLTWSNSSFYGSCCLRILTYPDCILTYPNCILGGLCQPSQILPSKDHVVLLGDGNYVWKKFIGKELQKSSISKEEFLTAMKVDTYYHICYEGCLTNFKI